MLLTVESSRFINVAARIAANPTQRRGNTSSAPGTWLSATASTVSIASRTGAE